MPEVVRKDDGEVVALRPRGIALVGNEVDI